MKLKARSWHYKYRPSIAHHSMIKYNQGLFEHFPAVIKALPILGTLAVASAHAAKSTAQHVIHPNQSVTDNQVGETGATSAPASEEDLVIHKRAMARWGLLSMWFHSLSRKASSGVAS